VCSSRSSATSLPDLPSDLSWEIGTVTEALLEYSWPQLSVFAYNPIPPARQLFTSNYPNDVIQIVTERVTSTTVIRITPDTHRSPVLFRISPVTSCPLWQTEQSLILQVRNSITGSPEQSIDPPCPTFQASVPQSSWPTGPGPTSATTSSRSPLARNSTTSLLMPPAPLMAPFLTGRIRFSSGMMIHPH
jgi:hypothetical protein